VRGGSGAHIVSDWFSHSMPLMTGRWRTSGLSVCLLTCYAVLLTYDLDRVPMINPDEAGYAEPAWTLITRGEFGAPMYAGMFGMEHRLYIICPGRGIMTVLPYMILGPTLTAARLVSVAMALVLALLSGFVLRRVLGRVLAGLDWLALVAVMTCPVVVNAGRFARPEIDVAAWTVAMVACLQALDRVEAGSRRRAWAMGAGVCAGLAFLMHQYGLVSIGAGLLIVGSPWRSHSGLRRVRDAGWMVAGIAVAVSPWAMFILSDVPEFRLQFGAQVAFQAWRYPTSALMRTLVNELPGRYLLDRQDYPVDWDPWAEALSLLIPTFSMSEPWWPLRLAVRIARRPAELGFVTVNRLWWMGISLAVVGSTAEAVLRSRRMLHSGVLLIPTLAWTLALAMVPNKWLGYAVTMIVIVGLAAYVLLCIRVAAVPFRRAGVAFLLMLTILSNASALTTVWFHAPQTRKPVVDALHEAIPPGKRILVPAREWHAFVGRNPAIGLDGRTLPEYLTTLLKSVVEFDAEYVVLVRNLNPLENRYYWVAEHGVEWADFLRARTELVRAIDGGQDEVIEVRKVVGDA
jgi:4-amino-4-deoxy-L-arabinose transferase-like glycosyltransferase